MALITVIGVNLCLSLGFYPHLLKYQMGNTVAKVLDEKKINKKRVILYNIDESRALHFYGKYIFQHKTDSLSLQSNEILITKKESLSTLQQRFPNLNTIFEGAYYGVSMLSLPFLNPETRAKETVPYVVVDLDGQP